MGKNLLDVVSAAEIMGINSSVVLKWCDKKIINCQDAPEEYLARTKYLIDERECDHIKALISKYGASKALLYYTKTWGQPIVEKESKEEMFDTIPWHLEDIEEDDPPLL